MDSLPIKQTEQALVNEVQKAEQNLAEWIFERVKPFVGGRMLEVDNGDGHMARFCRQRGIQIVVQPVDLADATFNVTYTSLSESFSMVIALHIVHDANLRRQVITNCANLLKKEGFLVIQLPLHTALYEGLDDGLEKWRWNNRLFMTNQLQAIFNIIKIGYCIVTDTRPLISQRSINYRERINVFNSALALGFDQEGLSAIVVGQKL